MAFEEYGPTKVDEYRVLERSDTRGHRDLDAIILVNGEAVLPQLPAAFTNQQCSWPSVVSPPAQAP